MKNLFLQLKKERGIVYCIGNGGSAGIASHFCNDLIKTLKIPSNMVNDSSITTCLANDYGYEYVYAKSLEILLNEHDILLAISSSGKSKNIINATKIAKQKYTKIITLSGFDPTNPLRQMGDLNFWLNRSDYGLVEMGHFFLLHTFVDLFAKISQKNLTMVC